MVRILWIVMASVWGFSLVWDLFAMNWGWVVVDLIFFCLSLFLINNTARLTRRE